MADVAPMLPLRYDPSVLVRVVAPPFDVIDAGLRSSLAARDPHNVVHVDLPEGDGDERYRDARRLFVAWQREGVLVRDAQPSFWRYAQTFEPPGGGARLTRKGFFALVRAVPFRDRVVLPHERTLTGPTLDRLALSRATRATLSPQFMLYADPTRALDPLLDGGEPYADFTTDDGIRHELWRIADAGAVAQIREALQPGTLLIADGHHRYETAVALAEELDHDARARGLTALPNGEHCFTFALLANGDDPSLVVSATHRLIHSLPEFDFDAMLAGAEPLFDIRPISGTAAELEHAAQAESEPALCAVTSGGRAALLVPRVGRNSSQFPMLSRRPESVRATGVALLHDAILEHVLGIKSEAQIGKTNIQYLQDASRGVEAIERGEGQVLFIMKPTSVAQVRAVAEGGDVMPYKSTFFYPKVPTGLFFHTLSTERAVP